MLALKVEVFTQHMWIENCAVMVVKSGNIIII